MNEGRDRLIRQLAAEGRSYVDIGRRVGLSGMRVGQIVKQGGTVEPTTTQAIATQDDAPLDTLVALVPSDVPVQQAKLGAFLSQKIAALQRENSDAIDSVRVATNAGWRTESLMRANRTLERRIQYYEKLKAAVEAGYLIVPNFEVDVMAVRVSREHAKQLRDSSLSWRITNATPDLSPAGEGRYVDDKLTYHDHRREVPHPKPNYQGQTQTVGEVVISDYDEAIDFPVLAVSPIVMQATAEAMRHKIFDRIGVVTGRAEDPVVVGQIIDPRATGLGRRRPDKMVTFFIAWWLDPKTL